MSVLVPSSPSAFYRSPPAPPAQAPPRLFASDGTASPPTLGANAASSAASSPSATSLATVETAESSSSPVLPLSDVEWARVASTLAGQMGIPQVDDWQLQTAKALARGENRVVLAGTGRGKSTVWALLAAASARLCSLRGSETGVRRLIMLVSVTKAMQDDQQQTLQQLGIPAFVLNEDTSSKTLLEQLEGGTRGVWILTPEFFNGNSTIRKLLTSFAWRELVLALVIDEAHTIAEWGGSFRPELLRLSSVVERFGSAVPIALLSATLPNAHLVTALNTVRFTGQTSTGLDVGTKRDELFFSVRPFRFPSNPILDTFLYILPPSFLSILSPSPPSGSAGALDASDLPKSVIFMKTRKECLEGCAFWRSRLPPYLRKAVGVFTGGVSASGRQNVLRRFKTGELRIVFATDAFGMGCDVPNVDVCLHVGKAESLVSLVQHFGRAGRLKSGLPQREFPISGRVDCIWLVPAAYFGGSAPDSPSYPFPISPSRSRPPFDASAAGRRVRAGLLARDPALYSFVNLASLPVAPATPSPSPPPPSTVCASESAAGASTSRAASPPSPQPPSPSPCLARYLSSAMRPTCLAYLARTGCTWARSTVTTVAQAPERCCELCLERWLAGALERESRLELDLEAGSCSHEAADALRARLENVREVERRRNAVEADLQVHDTVSLPPHKATRPCSPDERKALRSRLLTWRARVAQREDHCGALPAEILSESSLDALVKRAHELRAMHEDCINALLLREWARWILEGEEEEEVVDLAREWRRALEGPVGPVSSKAPRAQTRTALAAKDHNLPANALSRPSSSSSLPPLPPSRSGRERKRSAALLRSVESEVSSQKDKKRRVVPKQPAKEIQTPLSRLR